jgi:hypothetical protein
MGGRDKPGHDGVRELIKNPAALRLCVRISFHAKQNPLPGFRERFGLGAIRELEKMYAPTVTVARTK